MRITHGGIWFEALAALILVGCGASSSTGPSSRPIPPLRACVFPSTEELERLAAKSSLAVHGRVSATQLVPMDGAPNGVISEFHVDVERRWGVGGEDASVRVVSAGGRPRALLTTGATYILFLRDVSTGSERTFSVVGGMLGRFPIEDGRVNLYCLNYVENDQELARGSGQDLTSFSERVARSFAD